MYPICYLWVNVVDTNQPKTQFETPLYLFETDVYPLRYLWANVENYFMECMYRYL